MPKQQKNKLQYHSTMCSKTTLIIRHLPPDLSSKEKEELFRYFGAVGIKSLSSKVKKYNVVFVRFESENAATVALQQLHQLEVLGHRLSVEYAKGTTDEDTSPVQKHDVLHKREEEEESKENCAKYFEMFLHKLNSWNSSLNITQPPPSHLKYQYPPPTQMVLHNICYALASVPKFYTQVLHLMNKMNLPCPFDSTPFPEPDVLATPEITREMEVSAMPEASSEEEESELESDDEGRQTLGEIIPAKRTLPHKPKKVKRPKFIKPVLSTSVTAVKPVRPEEVFEKVEPVQRKIEMKLTTVTEADISAEKVSNQVTKASGSFGLMFPVAKETGEEQPDAEEIQERKQEEEKIATITAEELASNRISSRDQKHLPVFKNYQPGIPSCRLYIKNLSRQVTERDLHYIYRRYLISDSELEDSMFNVQLMKEGRMKGQAFITLQNVKQAEAALKETNGYILKDKPLVVQFARSAKAK